MNKHLQLACNNLANIISNTAPRLPPSPSMCNYHIQWCQISCWTYLRITCPLSLELISFWYLHLFVITHIPSPSKKPLFRAGLQFPLEAPTSASDPGFGWHRTC